jgi:hypothetical protein
MPPLRALGLHLATGFAIAAVFIAALLLADPGGIGRLLRAGGAIPLGLLWLFAGATFGVAFSATAPLTRPRSPSP